MNIRQLSALLIVAGSVFWGSSCLLGQATGAATPHINSPSSQTENEVLRFTELDILDFSGVRDVKRGTAYTYRSDDGVYVWRTLSEYHSSALASAEFDRLVKEAAKVVERPATVPAGKKAARRCVLLLRKKHARDGTAVVVRESGSDLWTFRSKSLKHALALERQVYPH